MKVLFIGGTGIISSACTALAIDKGIDLYLLNRGKTNRPIPKSVNIIHGDIRDINSVRKAIGNLVFDVVVNWIAFTPNHIETDLKLFKNITKQYIFISSASVYQTPPLSLPITESTPLYNPVWKYSQEKIACEDRLIRAYRADGFPVTIVRPSHTYDQTLLPFDGGYTVVNRMLQGKKVIVHGDGTSLWVLTNHKDFAKGFIGLLGNTHAIGESVHITSDELLTWNQIYNITANAAGTIANIIHVPSKVISNFNKEWGDSLLGDKAHSMIFDNTKIKRLVPEFKAVIPFSLGIQDILNWYNSNPSRQVVDIELDKQMDKILENF